MRTTMMKIAAALSILLSKSPSEAERRALSPKETKRREGKIHINDDARNH